MACSTNVDENRLDICHPARGVRSVEVRWEHCSFQECISLDGELQCDHEEIEGVRGCQVRIVRSLYRILPYYDLAMSCHVIVYSFYERRQQQPRKRTYDDYVSYAGIAGKLHHYVLLWHIMHVLIINIV